ncbi:S-layer homology domain-containing protein [Lysinibacillus piscis]|uniref:SLH domain-containing protein n=1 Tax=Lysinibacillus piscis TaxID=2518931 RepID=A0ABQ5NLP2_9BACI|nr:S-layer homology domain-containing protein [Lysinibacillus sp. KH24]GLC89276.1 hypothetical protein LYSBPC_24030 [Lysinibacillus sp. KH24]
MNPYKQIRRFLAVVVSIVMVLSMMPPMITTKATVSAPIKIVQIAAAQNNSIALKSDGTVIVWGKNVTTWAKPPEGLNNVVEIYAKDTIFLARKSNGKVVAWGGSEAGGINVPAELNNVISMASAGNHTLAVSETPMIAGAGAVIGWGLNGNGQSVIPEEAKKGVTKVAAGAYYSMALKFTGTVVDWGSNGAGATSKPANLSNVVAIDAGYQYALALKSDGTVVAWGKEHSGNGILNVPTGLNNVKAISANETHALALKSDGTVIGWGNNLYGKATPPVGLNDVVAIAAGDDHSLALKRDGTVVSWGSQTTVPGDNTLSSLTLEEGNLSPVFSSAGTSYSSDIAPSVSTVHIKAELNDTAYSSLYINDQLQKSGSTVAVPVPATGTTIKIRVEPYMQPAKTYTLTIARDREPPTVTFSPNDSATPVRGINTTIQVTDATSGVDPSTLEYAWTQSAVAPVNGWTHFSLVPSTAISKFAHVGTDGIWYLHIRAKDYAGNLANATSTPFSIDNTPPNINLTMQTADHDVYLNDTWTNKNIVVTTEATDAQSNIKTLQYTLDGGKTWTNYSSPIELTEPEVYTLIMQAVDTLDNVKLESRTVKISRGDLKLTPTMKKLADGSDYKSGEWTNQSVQISATADTGSIAIKSFTRALNGGTANNYISGNTETFFQDGISSFEYKVTDNLDNSVSALFTINIDKTLPTVSFSMNGNETSAQEAFVTAEVTDSGGSGLVESTLKYVWTQSTEKPILGWLPLNNGSVLTKEGVNGDWYLHIQGQDTAGNEMYAVSNRFVLETLSHDSTINPDIGSFDKNVFAQTDVMTMLTLNGNLLTSIRNGVEELVPNIDYEVVGNTIIISKAYLATQPVGTTTLTILFNSGAAQTLTIMVGDTTVVPDEAPSIIGQTTLILTEGYDAISTLAYIIMGTAPVTVSKTSGDDKITWNNATRKLDIAAGLTEGSYPVSLTASNGIFTDATLHFTLVVNAINGFDHDASLSALTVGGSAINSFNPNVSTYYVTLPQGTLPTSATAIVAATANNTKADVTITQATTLPGSATVQVTAEDMVTTKTYTIYFTMATSITGIHIIGGNAITTPNGTLQLGVEVMPINATNKAVNWHIVGGHSYASLNSTGVLTALSNGIVIVRATAQDGSGVYGEWQITISGQYSSPDNNISDGGSYTPDIEKPIVPTEELQSDMSRVIKKDVSGTVKDGVLTAQITEQMVQEATKGAQNLALEFNLISNDSYISLNTIIDAGAIDRLKEAGVKFVKISSTILDITFDTKSIDEMDKQSTDALTVSAKALTKLPVAAKKLINARPVFDITVAYQKNDKTEYITNFGKGNVTVGIAYKATKRDKTGNLYSVYVDKNGKPQLLANSSYNKGKLIFSRNSLSIYGVGHKALATSFTDTTKHWATENIDFVVSRNLMAGISTTNFAPNKTITRADFFMALGKLTDIEVASYKKSSFTDVKNNNPAMPYIEWAVKNKIVQGMDNGEFGLTLAITRQDMAVMMQNYAKAIDYPLPMPVASITFSDSENIAAYAKDAVKAVQQAGMMYGKGSNLFEPQAEITRAEAATILRRFIELVINEDTARGWIQNDAGQWQYIDDNGKVVAD